MLLLTALNDKGHVPVGSGAFIRVGLTGALLADLAIDGRLAVAEDGTARAAGTRPDDELLADVYDAVRENLQGRNVRQIIGGLSHHIGGSWDRVAGRLIDAGVLGRDRVCWSGSRQVRALAPRRSGGSIASPLKRRSRRVSPRLLTN